jgi:ABC-2 type transport system ATP-binding protein
VVADGSFEELRQRQGNKSLEQIFAQLTAGDTYSNNADDLVRALES